MQYTVDYFIKKFEAIPEDEWTTGSNGWYGHDGKFCAEGFCGCGSGNNKTQELFSLIDLFKVVLPNQKNDVVYLVNDGRLNDYLQDHPKQRILAALYDIKTMQVGQPVQDSVQVKEIIRYVAVPETIKELETVLN